MPLSETPARWLRRILLALTAWALAAGAWPWLRPYETLDDVPLPALGDSLAVVVMLDARPEVPGYSREAFGAGWAAQPGGCTTRQAVIAAQFEGVHAEQATCRLLAGAGQDPYTGEELAATDEVEIDHVFPLPAAGDMGAHAWAARTRHAFANDAVNLVATSKAANRDKSDQLPGEWLPEAPRARCWYARRVAAVAARWGLALSRADQAAMRQACRLGGLGATLAL